MVDLNRKQMTATAINKAWQYPLNSLLLVVTTVPIQQRRNKEREGCTNRITRDGIDNVG